jgi:hypothetical protein
MTTEEVRKANPDKMVRTGKFKMGGLGFDRRFQNFGPEKIQVKSKFATFKRHFTDVGYQRKMMFNTVSYILECLVLILSIIYIFPYQNL